MQKRYQWCSTHEDGYPVIREVTGRRFAAAAPKTPTMTLTAATPVKIKPMKLMAVPEDMDPKRPGSRPLPLTAKLKPAPSVPAAPEGLPDRYDFCVHQSDDGTRFLRFRDPTHKLHGADVTATSKCVETEDGIIMCVGGEGDAMWEALVCEQPEADKEPIPRGCCVDIESSTLVCPGSAYDGLVVSFIEGTEHEVGGVAHVSVTHPDLPGGGARIPVCMPVDEPPPRPSDAPDCCVDIESSTLQQCADERLNGTPVDIKGAPGPQGVLVGIPSLGWKGYLPVCAKLVPEDLPEEPPEVVPDICCFDPKTSSMVCEGTPFHGLVVELVRLDMMADGTEVATIQHERLPRGGMKLMVCALPPPVVKIPPEIPELPPEEIPPEVQLVPETVHPKPAPPPIPKPAPVEEVPNLPPPSPGLPEHCCYSYSSGSLECAGTELNGLKVRLVLEGAVKDGWPMVKVEHPHLPGGYAVVPVCISDCMGASRQVLDRAEAERSSEGQPTYLERWTKMAMGIAHASDMECPGRRFSATYGCMGYALGDGCIGGTGISDRHKEYAPLPGLRGWQKGFEG